MRRRGHRARSVVRSGNRSWRRGVNRDPPGEAPLLGGAFFGGGHPCAHRPRGRCGRGGRVARAGEARATGRCERRRASGVAHHDRPGGERQAGARFQESVAGFEKTHRHGRALVCTLATVWSRGSGSGSTALTSLSRQDSESSRRDEVCGGAGSMTLTRRPPAIRTARCRVVPIESRRLGQTTASAPTGARLRLTWHARAAKA